MSEPLIAMTPTDGVDEAADGGRRKQFMILGGVGAAALVGIGGFLLLSGGSSSSADTFTVPVHKAPTTAASATPSASASADQKVLPVYHGSVGDRDPFTVPAAVQAAQAPPKQAAAPASAAASATPTVAVTLPATTVTGAGGTVTVIPGSTATPTATSTPVPTFQWLQLLASHHGSGDTWTVDVRTANGEFKGVKAGTKNVGGTLFYFSGEDETSGKPTFVFQLGESMGANLTPNAKEKAATPHADKSTVVLKGGVVDGGIYAD